MHLRYSLYTAYDYFPGKHAQEVMKELGISYQHATPQSMGDQWWFWNCEPIPDPLPPYLSELEVNDPFELIGFGLNQHQAQAIKDYQLNKQ